MLRDPSLIPLSRQHQHSLALCVQVERALQRGRVDLGRWQAEMREHFAGEVRFHFAAEERVLFPAARRFSGLTGLVEELSGEHTILREYFGRADKGALSKADLQGFAKLLAGHIRKEERGLFEALQKEMGPAEMNSLGKELDRELAEAVQVCRLNLQRGEIKKS